MTVHAIDHLLPLFIQRGVKVVSIIVLGLCVHYLLQFSLKQLIRRLLSAKSTTPDEDKKRESTLIHIFSVTARLVLWTVVGMMVLQEMGFNIGPLLATAGIAGVALGFGGQYLIRDFITGFFIVLENQYRLGDVVSIDGTSGLVENINLRLTTLRDMDGVVHHIPHGEVKRISNLSKDFSRVNVNILVPYTVDTDRLIEVINRVGLELSQDPDWSDKLLTPPQFLRMDAFEASGIVVKILGDTKPRCQWDVAGELRKRLKHAFEQANIEMPYPRAVHIQQ